MIGHKFTYNGLTINDYSQVQAFKQNTRSWVITLNDVTGFSAPSVREKERPFSGNHGIIDYRSYIGKRVLTFTGTIVGKTESDLRTAITELMTALSYSKI